MSRKLPKLVKVADRQPAHKAIAIDSSDACRGVPVNERAVAPNDERPLLWASDALHVDSRLTGRGGETSYSSIVHCDGR